MSTVPRVKIYHSGALRAVPAVLIELDSAVTAEAGTITEAWAMVPALLADLSDKRTASAPELSYRDSAPITYRYAGMSGRRYGHFSTVITGASPWDVR